MLFVDTAVQSFISLIEGPDMSVRVLYFQVSDLQYASPATVSRCGMVFVDPKNLGYEPYWKRWLAGKFYYSNIHVMYPW